MWTLYKASLSSLKNSAMNSLKQTDYVYFTKSVIENNLSASVSFTRKSHKPSASVIASEAKQSRIL